MIDILNENNIVKECEFKKPVIDEVKYLLDKVNNECRNNFFHKFRNKCVYDIKCTNIINNEEVIVILNNSHDSLKFNQNIMD